MHCPVMEDPWDICVHCCDFAVLCCAADNQGYAEAAAGPDAQQQADNVRFTESLLPDWAAAASGPYAGAVPQALPPGSLPGVCPLLYCGYPFVSVHDHTGSISSL